MKGRPDVLNFHPCQLHLEHSEAAFDFEEEKMYIFETVKRPNGV